MGVLWPVVTHNMLLVWCVMGLDHASVQLILQKKIYIYDSNFVIFMYRNMLKVK